MNQTKVKNLPLSDELFVNWLDGPETRPFIYHYGNLAVDRKDSDDVEAVAWLASEAYDMGRVELSQRKVRAGVFQYIATKRKDRNNRRAREWRTKQLKMVKH